MYNSRISVWTILNGSQMDALAASFSYQLISTLLHSIASAFPWILHEETPVHAYWH